MLCVQISPGDGLAPWDPNYIANLVWFHRWYRIIGVMVNSVSKSLCVQLCVWDIRLLSA